MPRHVKQINGLQIDEISLVDKGANQHATVTIAKSADGEKEKQMDIFDEQGNQLDPEQLSHGDVVFDAEGNPWQYEMDDDAVNELVEENEPVLVGKSANPFRKSAEGVSKSREDGHSTFAEQLREELSKAATDSDRDEVLSKALGRVQELEQVSNQAVEIAKAERQARLEREYTEIAKSYSLPIPAEVLGATLLSCAEKLSEDECTVIAKCLEAASANIFAETGALGGGDNSDVLQRAEAEISKAADGEGGLVAYFEAHPEAYNEYLAETN